MEENLTTESASTPAAVTLTIETASTLADVTTPTLTDGTASPLAKNTTTPRADAVAATPSVKRPKKPLATDQDIFDAPPLAQLKLGEGLYVWINKNGKKRTYKFRSHFNGKDRWVTVGQYPDLAISKAQELVDKNYRANVDKARQNKSRLGWDLSLKNIKSNVKIDNEKLPSFHSMADSAKFIRSLFSDTSHTEIRLAIRLQMLMPWRSAELLTARWADFNGQLQEWTVNNMKISISTSTQSNQPQIEYISKTASDALNQLVDIYGKGEYLFPSLCDPNTSAADCNKAISQEIENIWSQYPIKPNTFKNFFITTANKDSYFKPEFIRAIVTHKGGKSSIYNNYSYEPQKRALAEWWGQELIRLTKISPPAFQNNSNLSNRHQNIDYLRGAINRNI
jgi:integrase